ncbi:MAG: hypothetical protein ACJA0N_000629 [Pseudohongiellaceae bacterium]|jgi:hypothetical protein
MTVATNSDFTEQLDKLDADRSVLQGLLDSARSLEALREGLETSLQLGQPYR